MTHVNSPTRQRRRRRITRKIATLATWAAGVSIATVGATFAAPAQASTLEMHCTNHNLSVALTDTGPADQTLWGQLCYRGSVEPRTVQLLVHGATYSHTYWDFPYGNGYYSYVDAATLAGYATFDVDRIGVGNSSHPASSDLTAQAGATALHDAITDLRSGAVDGHAFSNVIWVGHSLGSIIGMVEVATYHDVSAAVFTGFLNAFSPGFANEIFGDIYPAVDDPLFANSGLDQGYLTTVPNTRETLFYDPTTTDPNVLALDEATKQTATTGEESSEALALSPPSQSPAQNITVPVLLVDGQQDNAFCAGVTQYNCANPASVQAFESPYYSNAQLQVATVPLTGHDLALSTTAPATDAIITAWSLATIAP